jgi:hypothetical protein
MSWAGQHKAKKEASGPYRNYHNGQNGCNIDEMTVSLVIENSPVEKQKAEFDATKR